MQLTNDIFPAQAEALDTTGSHLFWEVENLDSLKDSLEEFGQTTPVLVTGTEDEYTLLSGRARVVALMELGKDILARRVEVGDAIETGLLYLADNAHRDLTDGMRLSTLQYFAPLMNEQRLRQEILPRLGVKPKSKDATLLLAWLTMDETWQALLLTGEAPLAAVTPLTRMDDADKVTVAALFSGYSWSRSNAVNALNWLMETARMTSKTVSEVMEDAGMQAIIKEKLSPKDAIAKLVTAARQARYPELTKLQTRFNAAAGEITAGTRWRLNQPNNFETGGAEITVQIKDAAQLQKALEEFSSLAESPAWNKLWNLGGQND